MLSIAALLGTVLACSFLLKELGRRFGIPLVVCQILTGLLLGLPMLKELLFSPKAMDTLELLSHLGILFLLFLAGWEVDVRRMLACFKDALLIALSTTLLSFVLGFSFLYYGLNYPFITSIVFGIALAVTAEATTTKVLMDMKALNTKLGTVMLGAGVMDNVLEVFGLALVVALAQGVKAESMLNFPLQLFLFVVALLFIFKLVSKLLRYVERKETEVDLFLLVIILMLCLVSLSEVLKLGALVGAIIGGFLLQASLKQVRPKQRRERVEEEKVSEALKLVTLGFLAPFFFVYLGLNFNFQSLLIHPLLVGGALAIAIMGKIVGALLVKPWSILSYRQLYVVGWAMNSRGEVGLIVALLAFTLGLLPTEIFSCLVLISLITTLAFPFVMQREVKFNPRILS